MSLTSSRTLNPKSQQNHEPKLIMLSSTQCSPRRRNLCTWHRSPPCLREFFCWLTQDPLEHSRTPDGWPEGERGGRFSRTASRRCWRCPFGPHGFEDGVLSMRATAAAAAAPMVPSLNEALKALGAPRRRSQR